MVNATVTVKDATGATASATAGTDGAYSGLLLDGLTAPFKVQACGLVDGNHACYYSVVQHEGTANVTPLTHAVVALALGSDPATMFAAGSTVAPPSAEAMARQVQQLKLALGDVLTKSGVSGSDDFATTPFSADRTGMDKVLDAVKISTGTDNDSGVSKTFVQLEAKIGSGNAYLDKDASSGQLAGGTGLDVDLKGITSIFVDGLGAAIAAPNPEACATRLAAANVFDDAFSLRIDDGATMNKATAPAMLCQYVADGGMLGGVFANPVLKDCDFANDAKVCIAGFDITKGEAVFDGAELAVVKRTGEPWRLLGRESVYDIHIGAAAQRSIRVDVPKEDSRAAPQYNSALSFDIGADDGRSATGVRAAKVYVHNFAGTSWEATPLVTLVLTEACIAQFSQSGEAPRLALVDTSGPSSCGASWKMLSDSHDGPSAAAKGDQLIDNFYKRGRQVRVDLFANMAATRTPMASIVKRVEGVPPKFAAMASFPWLELDSATRAALVSQAGTDSSFTAAWLPNATVSAKDVSFCVGGDCSGENRVGHADTLPGHNSQAMSLHGKAAEAHGYKMLSLYGRDHDQVGVSTSYISCGDAQSCR
ncbi:MAG: hypothetical protein ACJ8G7_14830 [Rhizobacter sp.]